MTRDNSLETQLCSRNFGRYLPVSITDKDVRGSCSVNSKFNSLLNDKKIKALKALVWHLSREAL